MVFNSPLFLFLFLPLFFILYLLAKKRFRRIIGLVGSLLFFSWAQLFYVPVMAGIILWNYWIGLRLIKNKEKTCSKCYLWLGIGGDLLTLVGFKVIATYGINWITLDKLTFSEKIVNSLGQVAFPLGLSYILFQTISYLVDVYKGRIESEKSIINFSLYIMLFPKILVGPITRYKTVATSFPDPDPTNEDVANGIRRFIQGFAKKILIADILALFVDAAFRIGPRSLTTKLAWLAIIAYMVQIYFDFSGYTDMALGLGKMMGFRFEENFNFPYISQSMGEFWRRWHISLSNWFRDYLFYPLERRRIKFYGQQLNIMIVFLLTGIWHGISKTFVMWGLLHGAFLVIESLFLAKFLRKIFRPLRHIYVLISVLITWIVFRSPNLKSAWEFLLRLLGSFDIYTPVPFSQSSPLPFIEPSFLIALVIGLILSMPVGPFFIDIKQRIKTKFPRMFIPLRLFTDILLFFLLIISIAWMANSEFTPGIYNNF